MREHLRALEVQNYSEFTVRGRAGHIHFFLALAERARHHRAGRRDAARARTLSAASLPLPQNER